MISLHPFLHLSPTSFSSSWTKISATPRLNLHHRQSTLRPSSSCSRSSSQMPSPKVEHIVLFNVKPDTSPSKLESMLSGLRSLSSLPFVLHLSAGPIARTKTSPFPFTHLLHSRYSSPEDLSSYASHPSHLSVVKSSVLPICDDVMALDWIASLPNNGNDNDDCPLSPPPGSAMRLTLLKLKRSVGDAEKATVLGALGGVRNGFPEIQQLSIGENFSPARAKGFDVGSLAIFPGLKEIDGLDEKGEMVEMHKEKVRGLLESVIVLDYLIESPPAPSL